MANTYSQITIHAVFAVQHRQCLLSTSWQDDLFKYMAGILYHTGCKSLAVNGWRDHAHALFGMPPTKCVADVMEVLKGSSSKWVNEQRLCAGRFGWQAGYGAFSVSQSHRHAVIQYILQQQVHHTTRSFRQEYELLLQRHEVMWDQRYTFEFFD